MAMVRDWFPDFASALVERSGRSDFPDPGSEYWADWQREFAREGVHWPEADAASSRVCNLPNLFINDYRPMVMAEIKKVQRESASPSGLTGSLDEAKFASKDCPDCGGSGHAIRYVHADILGRMKTAQGNDVPVGASFALPCSCPLGHHVSRGYAVDGKRPARRVDEHPSLRRIASRWGSEASDGLDNQYRHRPDEWDGLHGCPMGSLAPDAATY